MAGAPSSGGGLVVEAGFHARLPHRERVQMRVTVRKAERATRIGATITQVGGAGTEVFLSAISSGSPAALAGLQVHDVLVSVDGVIAKHPVQVTDVIKKALRATFVVERNTEHVPSGFSSAQGTSVTDMDTPRAQALALSPSPKRPPPPPPPLVATPSPNHSRPPPAPPPNTRADESR
jgi:hypothetical protein